MRHMLRKRWGRVINFAGLAAFRGTDPLASTTEMGIIGLTRGIAREYGKYNITANAIQPGFIATELMAAIPRDSATYKSYIENTPMRDVGQPEDVAALARFLIGPESRWITGTAINVDGGHHLRRGPDFGPFLEPVLGAAAMQGERPARK